MESLDNARKAFAPLGMRLHFFETGLHLIGDEFNIEINRHDINYIGLMDKVGRDVNSFDSVEVYHIAEEYLKRTYKIHLQLEKERKHETNTPATKWKMWLDEIHEYLIQLIAILDAREEAFKKMLESTQQKVIQTTFELPENFQASEFNGRFTPKMSIKQASLFLHFLRTQGYLPMYSDKSLAELSKAFFARNSQNVRDGFTNINQLKSDKKELKKLKEILSAMISEIETSYK